METVKKVTSFTYLRTGEGYRIAYTFSEMDQNGNLISQNNKGNYVVVHTNITNAIDTIINDIVQNHLSQ